MVELRQAIEESALRAIFAAVIPPDLQQLEDTIELLRAACQARDVGEVAYQDMAFHRGLVEAADCPELMAIWLPIISRMMLHYSRHENMMESFREHADIVDAIHRRDEEAAVAALLSNIQ